MNSSRWCVRCLITVCAVVILGSTWASAQTTTTARSEARAWIEENVPLAMEKARMPGFSIAVVDHGETIYSEGFGLRDTEQVLPATADTLFGIGSITKSFVAVAIMQLVEAGEISLDDPVSAHIPFELGMPEHPIRIRHLLTHSSGVPSLATSTVAISRGLGRDTGVPFGSADDFYRLVNGAADEVVAEPGVRFFYHNASWRMLGDIIQRTSGMPFHVYLKEKVINPVGMERTTLSLTAFEADQNHILPNLKTDEGPQPSRFPYPNPDLNPGFSFITAAGGIVSSANEMARYLNVQIEKGRTEDGRVASEQSFDEMQRVHIRRDDGYYGEHGYGFGLDVTPNFLGHVMIGHGGSVAVSTAYMAFVPDLKLGVVMMGNSSGMSYATIAESVLAILMGKNPEETLPAPKIRKRMQRLTGSYEVYRGLEHLKVVDRGGLLYIEESSPWTGKTSLTPLIPEDPAIVSTLFHVLSNGLKSPVEFVVGDEGKVDLIIGRYVFHKID